MDKKDKLIIRWDNAAHWKKISTFPHHKHVTTENNVHPSIEITIDQVLKHISKTISNS